MKTYIVIFTGLVLGACGQEPVQQTANAPSVSTEPDVEQPSPTTAPAVKEQPVVKPTTKVSSGGGGSRRSTAPAVIPEEEEPTPEPTPCVYNEECGEGNICVDSFCQEAPYAAPECVVDTDCPETYTCNENGQCAAPPDPEPIPDTTPETTAECGVDSDCAEDQFCNEAGSCELILPLECTPVGETVDPESVTVSPEGTGTTVEEIQADIDFTISQLQSIYPSLDALSNSLNSCSPGPSRDAIMERFTALDVVRTRLDNHLASQNVRLGGL